MAEQQKEKFPQEDAAYSHERLAKLRQEISVLEKKLAKEKVDVGVEAAAEPIKPASEGSVEKAESFSAPQTIAPGASQIQGIDPQNQVQALCDLAFQKGIDAAIEAARSLDNPYVLDELHDAMVGKLYERLKKEGKIEES
jgi:hypothetical protein